MSAPLQRMRSDDLMAGVFPDQMACQENLVGDIQIPDHPLVKQTVYDCLHEATDIDGLLALLRKIEEGRIRLVARDTLEPSPFCHEILNAKPYAFLDDAPLEERRTQAVITRRTMDAEARDGLAALDPEAITRVREEAWPEVYGADELHDALLFLGYLTDPEMEQWQTYLAPLLEAGRVGRVVSRSGHGIWFAAERILLIQTVFPDTPLEFPPAQVPSLSLQEWEPEKAWQSLSGGG